MRNRFELFYDKMRDMRRVLLCILLPLFSCLSVSAGTYKVITTQDGVEGSLRWAIEQANQETETSCVEFVLSSADTVFLDTTIKITSSVKIDGRSNDGGKVVVVPSAEKYLLFDIGKKRNSNRNHGKCNH